MKRPNRRGARISQRRMQHWLEEFAAYRYTVTEQKIDRWLEQFGPANVDLAARVLDCVELVGHDKLSSTFRQLLAAIPGWNSDIRHLRGKWRFVAYSSSAGESGDSMLHSFRLANRLDTNVFNNMFIGRSDLVREKLTAEDTVVFIDDFSGTGDTACSAWNEIFRELLATGPATYLILAGASNAALRRIEQETELRPLAGFRLYDGDDIFSDGCKFFTRCEKESLLEYCRIADKRIPRGYGNCGFVVVFVHRCPNNSIPILHSNNARWAGLFQRHI